MSTKILRTDDPVPFGIEAMEKEASIQGDFYDQAREVLAQAKDEARRRGIGYHRLRFYIDCWGAGYQYYIIEPRKRRTIEYE